MFPSIRRFIYSRSGNLATGMVILLIPCLLAVGMAVDYSTAENTRSSMQNALDAASFATVGLPREASEAERLQTLQQYYQGNGGQGEARIDSFNVSAGKATLLTSASFPMATSFMAIGGIDHVDVGVKASVGRQFQLTKISLKIKKTIGWWDKRITVFAKPVGSQQPIALMSIQYNWDRNQASVQGTTTVSKLVNNKMTAVYQRKCLPGNAFSDDCTEATVADDGKPEVSLDGMDGIYLQMDITAANQVAAGDLLIFTRLGMPTTITTKDPNFAQRIFVDGQRLQHGTVPNTYSIMPCDTKTEQAWEDGASGSIPWTLYGNSPYNYADFVFDVTSRCDRGADMNGVTLTE